MILIVLFYMVLIFNMVNYTNSLDAMMRLLTWNNIQALANSAFASSLVAALSGALLGALAAQYIAKWEKYRNENLMEVRNVNVAISISASILNSLLALKGDVINPLSEKYKSMREKYIKIINGEVDDLDLSHPNMTYEITLEPIFLVTNGISHVQDIVFRRLNVDGRCVLLISALSEVLEVLHGTISLHNNLVEKIKTNDLPGEMSRESYYFGVRNKEGILHNECHDVVNNLSVHINFALFAVNLICRDLYTYGHL